MQSNKQNSPRYLLLAYADERQQESFRCTREKNEDVLRRSGRLVAVADLQTSSAAPAVRISDGEVTLSDSCFNAAQQQLVGLYIIRARDLNDAIRVAATLPQACIGAIEVRPLLVVER